MRATVPPSLKLPLSLANDNYDLPIPLRYIHFVNDIFNFPLVTRYRVKISNSSSKSEGTLGDLVIKII